MGRLGKRGKGGKVVKGGNGEQVEVVVGVGWLRGLAVGTCCGLAMTLRWSNRLGGIVGEA